MGETVSSRFEDIVQSIIDQTPYDEVVHSREEELLLELKEVIEEGGGGGDVEHLTPEQMADLLRKLNS